MLQVQAHYFANLEGVDPRRLSCYCWKHAR